MSGNVIEIDQAEKFTEEILDSNKPAAVVFLASWCPHCQRFKPTFETLAGEYADKLKFALVDIDKLPQVEADNEVGLIPTVLIFQGGKIIHRFVNEQDAEIYRSTFENMGD